MMKSDSKPLTISFCSFAPAVRETDLAIKNSSHLSIRPFDRYGA